MDLAVKTQHAIRRSTRLPLEVPVLVTSLDEAVPFSESCNTTLVNAHGCGVIFPRKIVKGLPVLLEIASAKRHSRARVAEVVPLGGDPETWLVGLELAAPGNFWGIDYAPSDWKIEEIRGVDSGKEQRPDESVSPVRSPWRLTDLSNGACYMETGTPFQVNMPVQVSIRVSGSDYLLDGIVRLSHALKGMGVEFLPGQGNDPHDRVEELIDRLTKNREVPRIFVSRKERYDTIKSSMIVSPQGTKPDRLLDLILRGSASPVDQFLDELRAQRLDKRRDPRIPRTLPVLLTATDIKGRPLDQRVSTINISRRGALLDGVHGTLAAGATITLTRLHKEEQFQVAWVASEESSEAGRVGVAAIDPDTSFWDDMLEETTKPDFEDVSI